MKKRHIAMLSLGALMACTLGLGVFTACDEGGGDAVKPSEYLDGINYNPELTLKFTVGSSVGINGIKVSADGTVKVYTIDGVYVGQGKAADMLGKLAKGVYIVNGTKVVVK